MPDGSSRIDRSGEPSAVAATLTELSPGQERLKSVSQDRAPLKELPRRLTMNKISNNSLKL